MRPFQHISIVFGACAAMLLLAHFNWGISLWWLVSSAVIYIHILVLGSIYIRWNFYIRSLDRGANRQWIALSFDDGPAEETVSILNILKAENVPAAFFCIGKKAAASPDIVRRWHKEGHVIGNHSFSHGFNFDWQSATRMAAEIEQTNKLIRELTGVTPRLFRPPYGVTNPNLAKAIRKTGMYSIAWSLRSFDTAAKDRKQLLDRILKELKGGDLVLLHDSMTITREILTELITEARKKGFTFVRPDQLLGIQAYE